MARPLREDFFAAPLRCLYIIEHKYTHLQYLFILFKCWNYYYIYRVIAIFFLQLPGRLVEEGGEGGSQVYKLKLAKQLLES